MIISEQIPSGPLAFIKRCCVERKILWTYHVNMRMREKHISRAEILSAIESFEVIEEYPDDKYLPSYLVLADLSGSAFHILFATDVLGDNVRVVTAYRPNHDEWESDMRTRK